MRNSVSHFLQGRYYIRCIYRKYLISNKRFIDLNFIRRIKIKRKGLIAVGFDGFGDLKWNLFYFRIGFGILVEVM